MICEGRLLVDDTYPWMDVPANRLDVVSELFGPLGFTVMDAASLTERLMPSLEQLVFSGDLVLLPLMSGGLLADGVIRLCIERGAHVIALHTSKHPFVTLSGDDPSERETTLRSYEAGALTMEASVDGMLKEASRSSKGGMRLLFVDSNTARGRDALLVQRWIEARTSVAVDFTFVAAINETTHDVGHAPGWREGPKDLSPDAWAVRLVGSTTSYLSHLRFLAHPENEQFEDVRAMRSLHPELTRFWDALPPRLASIHGHRESTLAIHRERTHARLAREDTDRIASIEQRLRLLDVRAPARSTATSKARRRRLLTLGAA